ncbi:hypothetical protein A6723_020535 [Pseudomonas sp. AU11447]|nr:MULTISPECIES: hypothetical protein [unclassified Pseudomonas]OBY91001.1 hypothetical protein A6723_020535 [Pseudomonas sp. AU11447]
MNDKMSKLGSVPVMSRKTGAKEMLQPARRQEVSAQEVSAEATQAAPVATGVVPEVPVAEPREAVAEAAPEAATISKPKDKEQQKIESLADFLEYFYVGKTKSSLADATLRKLAKNARIEEVRRYELLALAVENDPTLEKSLNLMLLAADLNGYRGVEEQLRYFAADIGRRVNGQGKYSLESWLPRTSDDGLSLEAMANDVREAMQKVAASEVPAPDKKKAQRRLECGFYLACQWRLYQGIAPRELIGMLRRSILAPNPLQREQSDGLVRLLASQPFAEVPGLAWLLDDQARMVQQADGRADQLEREMRQLAAAKSLAEEQLKACEAELADKTARLNELQAQLGAAQEQSRIQEVHSNDDLSRLRGQVLRVLNSEMPILQDVLIALDRDPPKVTVAREYLGSVVEKLNKEIGRIKDR